MDPPATISAPDETEPSTVTSPLGKATDWPDRIGVSISKELGSRCCGDAVTCCVTGWEGVAMMSNCSLYPLEPLDPAVDPAYADGPPPPAHRVNHAGEIEIDWPVSAIPSRLNRYRTISFETLEDELERNAEREEHPG